MKRTYPYYGEWRGGGLIVYFTQPGRGNIVYIYSSSNGVNYYKNDVPDNNKWVSGPMTEGFFQVIKDEKRIKTLERRRLMIRT